MTLAALETAAAKEGLILMGVAPTEDGARALLGAGPDLWPRFMASPEAVDGRTDPLDRWSKRIIDALAARFQGQAEYPSDGPPYPPFIQWAKDTKRFWQSPTGMLVHDTAGLMISIRGAVRLPGVAAPPTDHPSPCDICRNRPCTTACPVGALSDSAPYDVPSCKAHITAPEGADCLSNGCRVRRACPVSQRFGRTPAQSAFHMRAFVGV